ncbi:MAG: hydroxyacid dehydrogenase [Clostridiales bacterium]|jgi:phosphoglycerate dehydrogenase-like enzyme|nr:hydroxyacid dehydrogenase [Clostridiales bacterium]
MRSLFILEAFDNIYGGEIYKAVCEAADVYLKPMKPCDIKDNIKALSRCEVLFTGWGAPVLDAAFLKSAPGLKAVFYGAGSVRGIVTDEFWDSGIPICSAWQAGAVPVAETSYALIVLFLKKILQFSAQYREQRALFDIYAGKPAGLYEGVAGLVSLGAVGVRVAMKLKAAKIKTLAYDPFITPQKARLLNVEAVSLLEIFERSDVISLHTPLLDKTRGMVGARLLDAMKPGAAIINTARGALINEDELVRVFRGRPDLSAFLDVTWPETVDENSPMWDMPNIFLSPHVAGSVGVEARRHGRMMLEEYMRLLHGEPLLYRVTREQALTMT